MKHLRNASLVLVLMATGTTPAAGQDMLVRAPSLRPGITFPANRQGRAFIIPHYRHFHRRWVPVFIGLGYRLDPLRSWDDGFFSDMKYRRHGWPYRPLSESSGEVAVVNVEARYHYDRGYPYDRYDYGAKRTAAYASSSPISCRTHWVWSDEERDEVPVRVCS